MPRTRSKEWWISYTNRFDQFGNAVWHYEVTGYTIDLFNQIKKETRLGAYVSATGSAGTLAAGDYLEKYFFLKV
jgi:cysteine synthase